MEIVESNPLSNRESRDVSRRIAIGRLVIGGTAVTLLAGDHRVAQAQAATAEAGQCVAVAPTLDTSGIAFVPLVSGSCATCLLVPSTCASLGWRWRQARSSRPLPCRIRP